MLEGVFTARSNRLLVARLRSSTTRGTNAAAAKPELPRVRDHLPQAFVQSLWAEIGTIPKDAGASSEQHAAAEETDTGDDLSGDTAGIASRARKGVSDHGKHRGAKCDQSHCPNTSRFFFALSFDSHPGPAQQRKNTERDGSPW